MSQKWWIIGGIGERDESRGWIIPNGVVTPLLGLLILFGWPGSTLWVLGTFLGVDLIVEGATFTSSGSRYDGHSPRQREPDVTMQRP